MTGTRVPPPVLAALAFGAQLVVSRRGAVTKGSLVGAALVGVAASWLGGGSLVRFIRQRTTIDPIELHPTSLVTTGPNRLTRNPMYLGILGVLISFAIARRSWRALVPAALFALAINRWQIPAEESALERRFGVEYARYRAATPRWLGCGRNRW